MYCADYHTHSSCSPDGSVPMSEMARSAVQIGLSALCFTDHCDLINKDGIRTQPFDPTPLREQFACATKQWGKQIQLRFGLELGDGQISFACSEEILEKVKPDFVIGSVHNLRQSVGGLDFYFRDYKKNPAMAALHLEDYICSLEELSVWDGFDVLGHIPYPLRYMRDRDGISIDFSIYMERLRWILTRIVQGGRGIELNTNRGRSIADMREILQIYRDCGGEIVTVGSDAHRPQDVGLGIREGYALLRDLGFGYITVYHARKPQFIQLSLCI